MVGQERGACDAEVQDAWADTGEAVQQVRRLDHRPSLVLPCTHGPAGSRRASAPAPWVPVPWSEAAAVHWSMFDVSVTNGAPTCTLAAIRGVMGAVRPLSSTARSTGAAGAAGAVVSRRCTQPSRGGRPRSAVARPRRCSPRCRGARARRMPARASPVLPARWEHASASTWGARWRVGSRGDVSSMPPSRTGIHRCAVRSWMSAAAAMSLAFRCHCPQPLTNNHARGCHVRSAKSALVPSVPMAHGGPTRTAQAHQWKRCRPLSHRARGSTASLRPRGHVMPSGQRHCRKESAAFWASCRDGRRCFMGVLPWEVRNPMRPIRPG